ncbi:MAG: bifunctional [glutamate--ammonia ligase]-adenylyl-L-tyrosine phosphorylase/[glutamate--ammonia-ligase] adenylyltransferase, partial [Candidatus Methylopumilus sp.]|nr:bifunctional [glutamate--ammonia ligase]-adenylyl-L-tyrosine phosphorylase/[glutamate--ammonia-ligase] adenylyltransferase [Candidatus Methylopumilus sp.]
MNTQEKYPEFIQHAIACSPFIQRLLMSDERLLAELVSEIEQPYLVSDMHAYLSTHEINDEVSLKRSLRKLRQRVMLRVITRDLNGKAGLQEVMQAMSDLAEVTVNVALRFIHPLLAQQYGEPIGESGQTQSLIVIGMGKLGGFELNVSSDIDLIFAFEEDGETNGASFGKPALSNHEFFTRVAKKLIAAIDEITEDGFVFRVDMRLRPYGSEGPLACSLTMLEEYYQNQGREWERYAWIKGRVIAGPARHVSDLLRPFVFRKYLDYGAFASMRDLKVQIQRDVNKRDMHDNIKLGRGGIREIEFIAQVFQLIRGGQDVSLQIRPTLSVLALLKEKHLLPAETVHALNQAYVFLRDLEHRLQYQEDQQTQTLPITEEGQKRIALAMNCNDWTELRSHIDAHRTIVDKHFNEVFSDPKAGQTEDLQAAEIWQGTVNDEEAIVRISALGYVDSTETLRRLNSLHQSPKYKQLPELSRQRFDALMPLVIALSAKEADPDMALMRVSDLLESICRRASYLALLAEYPAALNLVIKLTTASPWLAQYLTQHPVLLDELLDTQHLYAVPDFSLMRDELKRRLAEVEGDVERQMDVMRHFKHAAVFRFAAKDVAGELPLQALSDYLSALANLILDVTIETIWPTLRGKHRDEPKFAVIGYGKLGGKELGYASDLDIIFLYDDPAENAAEVYARFGQRINNWLNSLTAAGMLYETDLQLRPDGASGLLVSSVEAFREYQQHKAWVWEHQAITRANFSAGDASIGQAFEQIRYDVITQSRDLNALKVSVVDMRQRMRANHVLAAGIFDLKQSEGG